MAVIDQSKPAKVGGATKWVLAANLISPLSVLIGLLIWEFGARLFIDPFFLPPVSAIFLGAVELHQQDLLLTHIYASLVRILGGWILGSLVAIPIGLLVGSFLNAKRIIDPYIHFLRFIPAIALVTLFIVWFGVGELSKILLVMYATAFIVMVNTATGVVTIHQNKRLAARTFGASMWQIFWRVTIPAAMPSIYVGMRLALASSFLVIVAVEMLAAESGLGYLIWTSKLYFKIDWMFVGIFLLGFLGLLTDYSWKMFGKHVIGRFVRSAANY